jgi:hypothetical protein
MGLAHLKPQIGLHVHALRCVSYLFALFSLCGRFADMENERHYTTGERLFFAFLTAVVLVVALFYFIATVLAFIFFVYVVSHDTYAFNTTFTHSSGPDL